MLAIVAAILLGIVAFGGHIDHVNLFDLALAFWALHFAVDIPVRGRRNKAPQ